MKDEQLRFAERTLALRYPDPVLAGMQPSQLLNCRRVEDTGDDLWTALNRVQLCRAQHNWTYVAMPIMWSDAGWIRREFSIEDHLST